MKLGFRAKVLLSISVMVVCASISIAIIYLNRSRRDIENNYMQAVWKTLGVSMNSFDENARQAYNAAIALCYDETLQDLVTAYQGEDVAVALEISGYLYAKQQLVENVKHIYLYLPKYHQVITSEEYHAVQDIKGGMPNTEQETMGLSPSFIYDSISRSQGYMLSYICRARDGDEFSPMIYVNLDERRLFYQYFNGLMHEDTESYYLVDTKGNIASASSMRELGKPLSKILGTFSPLALTQEQSELADVDSNRFISAYQSTMTGYTLAAVSNRHALTASLRGQRNFIIGFLLIVLAAMLIPAYHMSGRVYAPVKRLKDAMQKVSQGDLSTRAEVFTEDEIGQLSKGFNDMVAQIEKLIHDLVNEQMQKKEAELEALQYQITPHFMYNTLNSIKYAAILQGNQEVGEQLGAFIELLQASIRRSGAFITVREEVRMVRNYIKIQQFRYMDRISVSYDLSEDAEGCYVPRLLLQPLVENAILHGQSGDGSCSVTVTTALAGNTLVLSVQDAGTGMSREQLAALMRGDTKSHFSGIGIPNIIERLRLYYGVAAGLQYTSSDLGTKAVILLPATTNAEEYTI